MGRGRRRRGVPVPRASSRESSWKVHSRAPTRRQLWRAVEKLTAGRQAPIAEARPCPTVLSAHTLQPDREQASWRTVEEEGANLNGGRGARRLTSQCRTFPAKPTLCTSRRCLLIRTAQQLAAGTPPSTTPLRPRLRRVHVASLPPGRMRLALRSPHFRQIPALERSRLRRRS